MRRRRGGATRGLRGGAAATPPPPRPRRFRRPPAPPAFAPPRTRSSARRRGCAWRGCTLASARRTCAQSSPPSAPSPAAPSTRPPPAARTWCLSTRDTRRARRRSCTVWSRLGVLAASPSPCYPLSPPDRPPPPRPRLHPRPRLDADARRCGGGGERAAAPRARSSQLAPPWRAAAKTRLRRAATSGEFGRSVLDTAVAREAEDKAAHKRAPSKEGRNVVGKGAAAQGVRARKSTRSNRRARFACCLRFAKLEANADITAKPGARSNLLAAR